MDGFFGGFFLLLWEVESASLTYVVAVVLHLFSVFQVHGPHVAVKQARGVGDCVRPRAARTQSSRVKKVPMSVALTPTPPGSRLPSSSFAFLVRNGDVEALVVDVDQRPEGGETDQIRKIKKIKEQPPPTPPG